MSFWNFWILILLTLVAREQQHDSNLRMLRLISLGQGVQLSGAIDFGVTLFHTEEPHAERRKIGTDISPARRNDGPDADDLPLNLVFHQFPSTAFENTAKHGVVDALRMANAALAATDELTSSYHRYFQAADLELVRKVFESVISEAVFAECADMHVVHFWYDDSVAGFSGCDEGLAAYHITPGPGVTGLTIVLCPELFALYPQPLETITSKKLEPYASEKMETIGLSILHEFMHLTDFVGGLTISDTHVNSEQDGGYVRAYGPYLSMLVNRDEEAGLHNADNFAFFAAESFFMQEFDLKGFQDPPPTSTNTFHPARALRARHQYINAGSSGVSAREFPHTSRATAPDHDVSKSSDVTARLPGTESLSGSHHIRPPADGKTHDNTSVSYGAKSRSVHSTAPLLDPQSFIQARYGDGSGTIITKRDDDANDNPFHMPFLPDNFQFADFPPNQALRNCAAMAFLGALRLADAADRALSKPLLSNSFGRYFQANQLCTVQQVFRAILQLSGKIPQTLQASQRVYTVYYGDEFLSSDACTTKNAFAYHIHTDAGFSDPSIVLCPRVFTERAQTLDAADCADVKASPYIHSSLVSIGFIMLHELLHDSELTLEATGVQIEDMTYFETGLWQGGDPAEKITAYGPYWSQYANDKYSQGILNDDNYAYFALETFLAEVCGMGTNAFADPPYEKGIPTGASDPY